MLAVPEEGPPEEALFCCCGGGGSIFEAAEISFAGSAGGAGAKDGNSSLCGGLRLVRVAAKGHQNIWACIATLIYQIMYFSQILLMVM